MENKNHTHLVSIIVRTKDRPKLLEHALESIAAQTYRPIEVVLVNDGGCDLDIEKLNSILGDISLNYIRLEKNTGRAHAGNAGIEHAKGDYIGFLDDDDALYPEHIETLAGVLKMSECKIAYVNVEMVIKQFLFDEKDFSETEQDICSIFAKGFSYADLLISNYIPFNSILFHKEIIETIGFLDESFDLYEDWDFLIRVGEKFPLYHVDRVTAIYNQWSQELQINQKDVDFMKRMHINVMDKHREKIRSGIILDLWLESEKRGTAIAEKEAVIAEKEAVIAEKEAVIAEKSVEIEKQGEIIGKKDEVIAKKDEVIAKRGKIITKKHMSTSQIERIMAEKDMRIAEKDMRIAELENIIRIIHETLGWTLLERIRGMRERLFPLRTERRKTYDLLIKSIKYIRGNGVKGFVKKVAQRYAPHRPLGLKDNYDLWISRNEPDSAALMEQRLSKGLKLRPKISIITPVYNPENEAYRQMIESVVNQSYDNWELCLADASSERYVRDITEEYIKSNGERIKVKYLSENYGIAGNSNKALSLVEGDYVALLDHDDTLAPFALYEVVKMINEHPEVDFIYSDRDKISASGKRFDPFFKPDWSPDYLLSQNYLCHLNVFRKSLIERIGGFRKGFDGSQDYDLVLRITETTDKIIHISKILYHWRIGFGSAAGDSEAKPYAYDAAVRALQDAVNRRGWKGHVTQGMVRGLYRVKFQIHGSPRVSIVIPTKDKSEILRKCVSSIMDKTTYRHYEIVIVDNRSSEQKTFEYYQELQENPHIKLLRYDKPFNFSAINNYAVSKLDSEYILFLNNDIEVITRDWLELMLGFAQRKETGAVGAKLLYLDETIQTAGLILDPEANVWRAHHRCPRNSLGYAGRILSIQNFYAIAAACMMVRREVFEEVGGFDPEFVVAHGDIDFCLKLRTRNYLSVYEPHAELYHHESLTRGYEDTPEKVERLRKETALLLKKWGDLLKNGDPYYNPNLGVDADLFLIKV